MGLLALYGVGSALCAYGAVFPPTPVTPRATNAVLAGVGACVVAVVLASRGRLPQVAAHLLLGVYVVGVGVSVSAAGTQAGALSSAVSVVWVGLYAALCFSPAAARLHNGFAVAVLAIALAQSVGGGAGWAAWAVVGLSALVAGELLARAHGGARDLARTDPLTGAGNRRRLEEEGAVLVERAARGGRSLTVAVLDLDGFKGLNDRHGHQVGDAMLTGLVGEWRAGIRREDLLARTGGDEFALLLPDTSQVAAEELLARLRARSAGAWTFGAASLEPGDDLDALLARADRRLYAAKSGRHWPLPAHVAAACSTVAVDRHGEQRVDEQMRAEAAHYKQALRAQWRPAAEASAVRSGARRGDPNVVGVGYGAKVVGSAVDEAPAVRVYVRAKRPRHELTGAELVPPQIDGLPTDVVAVGDLRALRAPVDSGSSVGHPRVTAGTIGAVVEVADLPGERAILSNNHVLAASNAAAVGDPILQPGPMDGGDPDDPIGSLHGFVPIDFTGGDNRVDVAVARLSRPDLVRPDISHIGPPVPPPVDVALYQSVRKFGRTTRHTGGVVVDVAEALAAVDARIVGEDAVVTSVA